MQSRALNETRAAPLLLRPEWVLIVTSEAIALNRCVPPSQDTGKSKHHLYLNPFFPMASDFSHYLQLCLRRFYGHHSRLLNREILDNEKVSFKNAIDHENQCDHTWSRIFLGVLISVFKKFSNTFKVGKNFAYGNFYEDFQLTAKKLNFWLL